MHAARIMHGVCSDVHLPVQGVRAAVAMEDEEGVVEDLGSASSAGKADIGPGTARMVEAVGGESTESLCLRQGTVEGICVGPGLARPFTRDALTEVCKFRRLKS